MVCGLCSTLLANNQGRLPAYGLPTGQAAGMMLMCISFCWEHLF
jgi:hypothetical protein